MNPEPTEQELEMTKEIILGSLAYATSSLRRAELKSVEEFSQAFDELQKDSIPAMYEAIKTKDGAESRLNKVTSLWDRGVAFLLRRQLDLSKLDAGRVALGLRTLRMSMEALIGHLILIERPELREHIIKSKQKPAQNSQTRDNPE